MNRDENHGEERRQSAPLLDRIDTVLACILLAGCAVLFYATTTFDEPSALLGQNVLPEQFPQLLLYLIAILSLIIPFEHRLWPHRWQRIRERRSTEIPLVTWWTIGMLITLVVAAPYLGTMLTVAVLTLAMPLLWGERRWWLVGLFVITFTAGITVLFSEILQVYFEPGIFGISF